MAKKKGILKTSGRGIVKKGKKVTWGKGHSSDSNPTTKAHRLAAIQQWASQPPSQEKMGRRGKIGVPSEGAEAVGDGERSVGGESVYSSFTNCSNPTFDRVHRVWKSGSPLQKDVLAVLGAVTEVIHSKGGEETETEYFAALSTTIDSLANSGGTGVAQRLSAAAYLLNLVLPKVPASVLRAKFTQISQQIYKILGAFSAAAEAHLLHRYLISCFFALLKAQPLEAWNDPFLAKIFEAVLTFSNSPQPRVRKSVRAGLANIIHSATKEDSAAALEQPPHPAFRICAEFVVTKLNESDVGKKEESVKHLLDLLAMALPGMSPEAFKVSVETVFKVLSAVPADSAVGITSLHTLDLAFSEQPPEVTLPPELNVQILNALLDFRPSESEGQAVSNWLKVLAEGVRCLAMRDLETSTRFALKFFEFALPVESGRGKGQLVTSLIETIIADCCGAVAASLEGFKPKEKVKVLGDFLDIFRERLSIPTATLLPALLYESSVFFSLVGEISAELRPFRSVLLLVTGLKESEEAHPSIRKAAEDLIWTCVRFVGVEPTLSVLSLNLKPELITPRTDFQRAWLLPLLKKAVGKCRLDFYFTHLFPLAVGLFKRLQEWKDKGEARLVQVYATAEYQIWDLLPAFCKGAEDVTENFSKYAKFLGVALTDRPDVRIPVMASLRNLYSHQVEDPSVMEVLKAKAHNYSNILVGLYTSSEDGSFKKACLATIRVFLQYATIPLLDAYLEKSMKILRGEEGNEGKELCLAVMDLVVAMVPRFESEGLEKVVDEIVMKNLKQKFLGQNLEKKTYRILEELCKAAVNSQVHEDYLASRQKTFFQLLFHDARKCAPPSVASRLSVGAVILERTAGCEIDDWLEKSWDFVVELIHALVSSNSVKTKKTAAQGLVKLVVVRTRTDDASQDLILRSFLTKIEEFAVDNGEVKEEVAAALTAKRLVFHEFHEDMSHQLLAEFISPISKSAADSRTPVAEQALLFLKKLVNVLPEYLLISNEEALLTAFYGQDPQVRKNLRRTNENILRALIRRLGVGILEKYAPPEWHVQMKNLRKRMGRAARKGGQPISGDDAVAESEAGSEWGASTATRPDTIVELLRESDDEEDDVSLVSKATTKKTGGVWLKEEGEDDILDLLDTPTISRKVSTKDPVAKKSSNAVDPNRGFKLSKDGRLIINEEEEAPASAEVEEDSDEEEFVLSGRKRRKGGVAEGGEAKRPRGFGEYKEGGSGIHRPLGGGNSEKKAGGDKKKKGQTVQPYAYIPLEHKALNPRKKAKFQGRFKNIVKGARKGAAKGRKGKRVGF